MFIRDATLEDVNEISKIDHFCFRRGIGFNDGSVEVILTSHSETLFLVAEHEGRVAGYIFVIPQDGSTDKMRLCHREACVAQIASLAVAPDFRRMGVAGKLIEFAAREVERRFERCHRVVLEVSATDSFAQSLYLKAGFRPVEYIAAYYSDKTDAIRYERLLRLFRCPPPTLG